MNSKPEESPLQSLNGTLAGKKGTREKDVARLWRRKRY
jgi:hypothetical protein